MAALKTLWLSPAPSDADIGMVTALIVRDSDGAVMVAAGPTAHPSAGVWTYDAGPLLLDSTRTYTLSWVSSVLGAVGSEQIPTADDSRTLRGYRRSLFRSNELGPWSVHTTSQASAAANELIALDLADADLAPAAYNGVHCYVREGTLAGQQRRVANGGFTPATGRLLVHRPFSETPTDAVVFELCHRLPAIVNEAGRAGVREIVNRALEVSPQVIRLSFSGVSQQYAYPLAEYPWLRDAVQLGPVFDPASTPYNALRHAGRASFRLDAERPYLELDVPFTTGQTFAVELAIPGPRWIKSQGAWGFANDGLQADDDEALVDPARLRPTALAYAFRALAETGNPTESEYWSKRADLQELRAAQLRAHDGQRLSRVGRDAVLLGGARAPSFDETSYTDPGRTWM